MDQPGGLTPQEYVDIIAFILKANGFPTGAQELPIDLDALKSIAITHKK
jgi:hypothetical protein